MDKAIFILGPTGVGKSDIGIWLALKLKGEIISSDSVQIYKGFDIGSAKITKEEMQGVKHYAIDIVEPNEYFSVYDYVEFTRQKIHEINEKGKVPIVVGGTGLYIKALIEGYNFGGTDKHDDFREKLKIKAENQGSQLLWNELEKKNPQMAEKISPNNTKRLIRALELCQFGSKLTKNKAEIQSLIFALNLDREILYDRINKRVDKMIEQGLFKEVENLLKQGVKVDSQPMRAIGYKEVVDFLNGSASAQTTIDLIKQHSRNYAKRQLTFLRGMENVIYVDALDRKDAFNKILTQSEIFLDRSKQ